MVERLFVYGSLAPGQPNEHVLSEIGGTWETASVTGTLHQAGWGAALGYPGIKINEQGDEVQGVLFSSEKLGDYWPTLDAFEGEAYERVLTVVTLKDETTVAAHIYQLSGK